jgi:hypothetical protein
MKIEIEKIEVIPALPAEPGERSMIMSVDDEGLCCIDIRGDNDDYFTMMFTKGQVEVLRDSLNMFLNHVELKDHNIRRVLKDLKNNRE